MTNIFDMYGTIAYLVHFDYFNVCKNQLLKLNPTTWEYTKDYQVKTNWSISNSVFFLAKFKTLNKCLIKVDEIVN